MDSDKLSIDLKARPEVAAALAGASAGDMVTIKELTICVDEIAHDVAVGSICDLDADGITVTEHEDSEDAGADEQGDDNTNKDETSQAEAAAPVLSVMSQKYKK